MPQDYKKYPKAKMDGRIKIDPALYDEIRNKYAQGGYSWRTLGIEYGVNKGTIGKIVNDEYAKRIKTYNVGIWKNYYNKDSHRLAIKKYRDKKRRLGLAFEKRHFNPSVSIVSDNKIALDKI